MPLFRSLFLVLSLSGCLFNAQPVTAYTPAQACGGAATEITPPEGLSRWPYPQNVGPTSASIAWGTAGDANWSVRYGKQGAQAMQTVSGATERRIDAGDRRVHLQSVKLTGLVPGARYCYALAGPGGEEAGVFSFQTAPAGTDAPVRFMVVGDYGVGSPAQARVRDQMLKRNADLLITTGDNAYLSGTFAQFEENVFDIYRPLFLRIPVFPSPGNHDYRTEKAAPYLTNFFLPENAWNAADRERYYSFDWGAVHFVALDSETPLQEAGPDRADDMLDWLEADLRGNRRPWVVAYFHRPAYTTSATHGGNPLVREKIIPVLEKYQVPIVFTGHNHLYERFYPIRDGKSLRPAKGGIVYITTGGGGTPTYAPQETPFLAEGSATHHFIAAQADACVLRFDAVDDKGQIFDRFAMQRCK